MLVCALAFPFEYGLLLSWGCLFVCGLTGGIDYLLLFLYKLGKLEKSTEKRLNRALNMWVRLPGILSFPPLAYVCWAEGRTSVPGPVFSLQSVLNAINAIYFAQRVTENCAVHHYRLEITDPAAPKVPWPVIESKSNDRNKPTARKVRRRSRSARHRAIAGSPISSTISVLITVMMVAAATANPPAVYPAALPFVRTSATDAHFYDAHGRVRIFHGCNRVSKSFPWYFPQMLHNDTQLDRMRDLGFTTVRLGWMWSGFNPSPGVFNMTYAKTMQAIVARLGARGIYTLLDMHQDVMSSKFCLYDGVPLWVVNKSTPKHAFPWPLGTPGVRNCSSRGWMINSLTEAAAHAYQDLFDNTNGMLDDMAAFWKKSAEVWRGNPNVLGYELINEPFAGDFFADPLILLPGNAGRLNLARMYEHVSAAVREVDDETIIFFEPVTWGMLFSGKIAGSGFTEVPGGPAYRNRSAFSFHYYCKTFSQAGHGPLCDDVTGPLVMAAVKKDLALIGGSAMMTEGLSCDDDAMEECQFVANRLDGHLFSWTDYAVSQGDAWEPSPKREMMWARAYARAVAGTPLNMSFDGGTGKTNETGTRDFEFCFRPDPHATAPTEIFLASRWNWPGGARVDCNEGGAIKLTCTNASDADVLLVEADEGAKAEEAACVRIRAAEAQALITLEAS